MQVSQKCIDLIKKSEGFEPKAYLCPAGIWTVGYGSTRIDGRPVKSTDTVTLEKAEKMLQEEVSIYSNLLSSKLDTKTLTQGMFDALVSITFNVGPGSSTKDGIIRLKNGKPSSLLRKTMAGDKIGAADEFLKWVRANGVVLAGLVIRRTAERNLFLSES